MKSPADKAMSNHEIVTLAVFLSGGDSKPVDTEDVAVKANELAPGRFTWRKYADQINIDTVRKRLWDATKPEKGGYLFGSEKKGWLLTPVGLAFAKDKASNHANLSRKPANQSERAWMRSEKLRMIAAPAFDKICNGEADKVTEQEAEAFFRLDSYVTGKAREQKLLRARNVFGDDPELGEAIKVLETKVRRN